jgi:hypothetical protein
MQMAEGIEAIRELMSLKAPEDLMAPTHVLGPCLAQVHIQSHFGSCVLIPTPARTER